MERRLAAILAADVVGYSRLMGVDEAGTLERLKSVRRQIVQPRITEGKGRIVKLMGDGLLAEFSSVVEAIQCAVDIQQAMVGHETDVASERRIQLRIGINLGDIIAEGSDIYGDGVNVAARLEGLAKPGGICISGVAFDAIDQKLDLAFEDIGLQQVKNIAKPIRAYQLAPDAVAKGPMARSAERPPTPEKPSIAVLPFVNISGDPEQEYFSDGITEDLITELSRFKELSVVSRSSSFVFKGRNASITDVSEKLKAQYLVEGSIRKAGNRVRVTAQLIDADTDQHIWADRYDRQLEDIFEVQDDIVHRVASTLVARLEHQRQERARRRSKNELRAYDLYLRGREHFFTWSLDDNLKARDLLRLAIDTEPEYAAALALLSEVQLRMWLNGWSDHPNEDLAESFAAAKKAVEIDDQDSRTHTALGMAYLFQQQPDRAKSHFEAAVNLNPNDTRALVYYSRHAVFDGDSDKAVDLCRQARTLNPFGKYNWNLAIACYVAHRYQETIELLEGISNPPAAVLALLAAAYAMANDQPRASTACNQFLEAAKSCITMSKLDQPSEWQKYFSARWPFREPESLSHLVRGLRKAGLGV